MTPHPLFRDFIRATTQVLHEGDQRPLPLDGVLVEDRQPTAHRV
jgi:hypothetical protein